MSEAVVTAPINVPQAEIDLLRRKLDRVRWPDRETCAGWEQGVPLAQAQALISYWRDRYDWRRCEDWLNRCSPWRTVIDGLGIHFLHVRSPHANALPLLTPLAIMSRTSCIDWTMDNSPSGFNSSWMLAAISGLMSDM